MNKLKTFFFPTVYNTAVGIINTIVFFFAMIWLFTTMPYGTPQHILMCAFYPTLGSAAFTMHICINVLQSKKLCFWFYATAFYLFVGTILIWAESLKYFGHSLLTY